MRIAVHKELPRAHHAPPPASAATVCALLPHRRAEDAERRDQHESGACAGKHGQGSRLARRQQHDGNLRLVPELEQGHEGEGGRDRDEAFHKGPRRNGGLAVAQANMLSAKRSVGSARL